MVANLVQTTFSPPTPEGTWLQNEAQYMQSAAAAAAGLYEAAMLCPPAQQAGTLQTDSVSQARAVLFQGTDPGGTHLGRLDTDGAQMKAIASKFNALAANNVSQAQQINALETLVKQQAVQISQLQQAGPVTHGGEGGGAPTPDQPQSGMSTSTLLIGLLAVAAIGAGVWYVGANAKKKAHEAMEAGFYTPPAKQLGASTKAELVKENPRRHTHYHRRRKLRRGKH